MVSRFSRWPRRPFWIVEGNDSTNSESLCHSDASHQVLAQFDLGFGRRRHLKNFKIVTMAAILDTGKNDFCNSESLCHSDTSHQVSAQSDLEFGRCHLKNFKMAVKAAILDIRME